MFKKILALIGKKTPTSADAPGHVAHEPYKQDELNLIYKLMFCDDAALFKPKGNEKSLFGDQTDPRIVRAIADDPDEESRVRILAYNWLRENGQAAPGKELLGVIVEVPLEEGLDVLAAYADGTVRYINQTGRFAVFESGPPDLAARARTLVQVGGKSIAMMAPARPPRRPPPAVGNIRLSYLVSDGLYMAEGPFETMAKDKAAAPVIQTAQALLELVVRQATE